MTSGNKKCDRCEISKNGHSIEWEIIKEQTNIIKIQRIIIAIISICFALYIGCNLCFGNCNNSTFETDSSVEKQISYVKKLKSTKKILIQSFSNNTKNKRLCLKKKAVAV